MAINENTRQVVQVAAGREGGSGGACCCCPSPPSRSPRPTEQEILPAVQPETNGPDFLPDVTLTGSAREAVLNSQF